MQYPAGAGVIWPPRSAFGSLFAFGYLPRGYLPKGYLPKGYLHCVPVPLRSGSTTFRFHYVPVSLRSGSTAFRFRFAPALPGWDHSGIGKSGGVGASGLRHLLLTPET